MCWFTTENPNKIHYIYDHKVTKPEENQRASVRHSETSSTVDYINTVILFFFTNAALFKLSLFEHFIKLCDKIRFKNQNGSVQFLKKLYVTEKESVIIIESLPELRLVFGHYTDLQLRGLEVHRQHRGQTRYGHLQQEQKLNKTN